MLLCLLAYKIKQCSAITVTVKIWNSGSRNHLCHKKKKKNVAILLNLIFGCVNIFFISCAWLNQIIISVSCIGNGLMGMYLLLILALPSA